MVFSFLEMFMSVLKFFLFVTIFEGVVMTLDKCLWIWLIFWNKDMFSGMGMILYSFVKLYN